MFTTINIDIVCIYIKKYNYMCNIIGIDKKGNKIYLLKKSKINSLIN